MRSLLSRLFLVLSAIGLSSLAHAGPKPPEYAAEVGVTPTYQTTSIPNVPIDANVTPPTRGLTDIPSTDSGWIITGTAIDENNSSGSFWKCFADGGTAPECKFRTHCNDSMTGPIDPIRNYGTDNSHDHLFFGARKINPWTTYSQLRHEKASNCAGGQYNNSIYWMPLIRKDMGGGVKWGVRPKYTTVYYNNVAAAPHKSAHLGRGIGFVFGSEMDDDWTWLKNILTTANANVVAAGGMANRYTLPPQGGFITCGNNILTDTGATTSRWFKNANGTDPWQGRCTTGNDFVIEFDASSCWNGVDLWSHDGYHHVIPRVTDNLYGTLVCPTNYYTTVTIMIRASFMHSGFSDYGTWDCSSDAVFQTVVNANLNPHTIGTCESLHSDFKDGWDGTTRFAQETNCGGVENGVGHLCSTSVFSATQSLLLNAPAPDSSRNPQITCTDDLCDTIPNSTSKMWKIHTTIAGPHTQTMTHM